MTPRRARFALEYPIDLNATQSAIRAGYNPKTAKSIGARLLTFVDVQEAIKAALEARAKSTEISAEYVIEKLKREINLDGDGSPSSARVRAVELLGKHIGMFNDKIKVEHSGEINLRAEIRAAALEAFGKNDRH